MIAHLRQVGGVLVDGVRSAVFLKPRDGAFDVGLPVCVTLCLLSMCAAALFAFAWASGPVAFNVTGIVGQIANLGALVALLCLVPFARAGAAPHRLFAADVALTTVVLSIAAIAGLGLQRAFAVDLYALKSSYLTLSAIEKGGSAQVIYGVGMLTLAVLGLGMLVRLGFGLATRARALVAVGFTVVSMLASVTFPDAALFVGRETQTPEFSLFQTVVDLIRPPQLEAEEPPPRPRIDAEAAMTRQPELMATALATLQPPRPDRAPDWLGTANKAVQESSFTSLMPGLGRASEHARPRAILPPPPMPPGSSHLCAKQD